MSEKLLPGEPTVDEIFDREHNFREEKRLNRLTRELPAREVILVQVNQLLRQLENVSPYERKAEYNGGQIRISSKGVVRYDEHTVGFVDGWSDKKAKLKFVGN